MIVKFGRGVGFEEDKMKMKLQDGNKKWSDLRHSQTDQQKVRMKQEGIIMPTSQAMLLSLE